MTLQNSSRYSVDELVQILKKTLIPLFEKYPIHFGILAGSWVRNQHQWWSDIDIFISWPDYLRLSTENRLEYVIKINSEAEKLTQLNRIEIRILEKQTIHAQYNILKEGVLLCELISNSRNDYLGRILPIYYDHIIWFSSYLNESLGVEN